MSRRLLLLRVVGVILNLLEDAKWHSLTEIADKSGLRKLKAEIVTNFLAEYDFMQLDKAKHVCIAQLVILVLGIVPT